ELIKKNISGKSFVLDSEVVGFDRKTKKYLPFEAISQRIRRKYEIARLVEIEKKKYPHLNIGAPSIKKRKTFCGWPFFGIFITVDGFITPCCIRMNPEVFNFGNIYQDDFNTIWNGEKYKKFRKSMIRNLPNNICDNCPN
ncbi:MAG: hypothetical protein GYA31_03000, partial [Parcubacteria group bacterium]|nr:hypothetical protein [Parcubacteria group bacterium]